MKPIIYLDMDGVLCDFVTPAMALLGAPNCEIPRGEPDMEKWPAINMSKNKFWKCIEADGPDFWPKLKKYAWTDELMALCESIGDVFILTSPSQNPNCSAGKVQWITKYYPHLVDKMIMTGHKYMCAAPGRILIDDTEKKTSKFNEYGGRSILFPQPWNSNHHVLANVDRLTFVDLSLSVFK